MKFPDEPTVPELTKKVDRLAEAQGEPRDASAPGEAGG